MEEALLSELVAHDEITNSFEFAQHLNKSHQELASAISSLSMDEFIIAEHREQLVPELTDKGKEFVREGSPEVIVYNYVLNNPGVSQAQIQTTLGEVGKFGFSQAMKNKWIGIDKETKLVNVTVDHVDDTVKLQLEAFQRNEEVKIDELRKRKLIDNVKRSYFVIRKGPNFAPHRQKPEAELTYDMVRTGNWKTTTFKEYNFNAKGKYPAGGHLHPLLKVRAQVRNILLDMGFEEMPTNTFVVSSFWNFDALFQPQAHPARDAHDTFFIKSPEFANDFEDDYRQRVQEVHERGGYESIGFRYKWSIDDARKNVLRTHTTANSSKMLYKLAQNGFKPKKYFSIDRVFRNETLDATHLAEFHQIEGVVADRNIGLADLIGIIAEFFRRMGITDIKFKPAYNPYTEPSMEIFGYHPILKKWTEIGNSGVFRPEMLRPMGLPEDVNVLGWGLSLERPTMIQYSIGNIRDLFGSKLELSGIQSNPICRFKTDE
ncbi:unnamed protein product [Blepharisma stoltei]|uniref:phenylalanine--tRNA ligase n=1 Tax=Blepharisma stoltei TaxID=1481888 RepID=A0AAU9JI43_9CILI|nr:unnamed protein product [Blepharisma stoltei]